MQFVDATWFWDLFFILSITLSGEHISGSIIAMLLIYGLILFIFPILVFSSKMFIQETIVLLCLLVSSYWWLVAQYHRQQQPSAGCSSGLELEPISAPI